MGASSPMRPSSSRVKSVRQALGDDGKAQRFIKTIHGQRLPLRRRRERRCACGNRVSGQAQGRSSSVSLDDPAADQIARPSIAVLPFRLIGEAGRYAAIADALPHELIAELARLRWLFVTARGSSFRLRAPLPDMGEIGRLLGVRYCLSGTVEIAGASLTVTVELVDTRDGGVVWAEQFAGAVDDVHRIRADIRARILTELEIRIPLHEAALRASDGDREPRFLVGLSPRPAAHVPLQPRDNAAALALFERAVALDPGFARAHAGLSFVALPDGLPAAHGGSAPARRLWPGAIAERGLELDPIDPFVNFTMGRSFWLVGDLDGSLRLARARDFDQPKLRAGDLRPRLDRVAGRAGHSRAARTSIWRCDSARSIRFITRCWGPGPSPTWLRVRTRRRPSWAERAASAPGAHVLIAMIAVAAHALSGDEARAASWAANVRARNPGLTRGDFFRSFPMKSEATKARVAKALARFGF